MSGTVASRKRLLTITEVTTRARGLDISAHRDFFPDDCPPPRRGEPGAPTSIVVTLDGLDREILTGIPRDPKTGRPKGYLQGQTWLREFVAKHRLGPGDVVALERTGDRRYRLYAFETKAAHAQSWQEVLDRPLPGSGPTVLELFAGCGGMALGFKRAGFRTVLCNEWDAAACETIRHNITDRVAQCAIQEIESFPPADVIAGGPPCQGFSNLGEKVPNDPRNQLWRQYVRAVLDVRPKVFVLENVPPILKSQEYQELRGLLEKEGYSIEGRVLNSADFGVPQTRRRAFVIGTLRGVPSFPEPTHADPSKKRDLPRWRTVRDAFSGLPVEPTEANWHIGRNPTPMSLERYRSVPPGGNRWDLPPHLMPDCWKRKTKGGTDLFGRLWWDRPSVTIRCEFYKPEKGRYLHPEAHRPITHREAARLQGFPDSFDFQGKRIEVGVQIGNAVPPGLAEAVARHVAEHVLETAARRRPRHSAAAS